MTGQMVYIYINNLYFFIQHHRCAIGLWYQHSNTVCVLYFTTAIVASGNQSFNISLLTENLKLKVLQVS